MHKAKRHKAMLLAACWLGLGAFFPRSAVAAPHQQTAARPASASSVAPDNDMPNGDYGGYYTWPELKGKINEWAVRYPRLVHVGVLGKTLEGREIPLLRLSDDADINESEPEILLMAGIHPREQQPQVCLVRFLDEILAGYGKDERITKLLQGRQIWIIPVLNVDGKVYDMRVGNGVDKGADWRKNRRPNPDGTMGVDLNRNFPVRWGGGRLYDAGWKAATTDTKGNIYEGPQPASEPETQALMRFVESRPRLRAFLDIHSPLRIIYYPSWLAGPEYDRVAGLAKEMAARQKEPYPVTQTAPDTEPKPGVRGGNSGLTYTWTYYVRGVYGLNFEIGLPTRYPPVEKIHEEYEKNVREPLLHFLDAAGNLPLTKPGVATLTRGAWSGAVAPGAALSWTPEIAGPCDYAVLVSESPAVTVGSEYRLIPAKTGFTVEVSKDAKPGAECPLTLYLWTKDHALSVQKFSVTVARP